ncbi:unnamed protein product, partial [Clonostachys rhizophaga]
MPASIPSPSSAAFMSASAASADSSPAISLLNSSLAGFAPSAAQAAARFGRRLFPLGHLEALGALDDFLYLQGHAGPSQQARPRFKRSISRRGRRGGSSSWCPSVRSSAALPPQESSTGSAMGDASDRRVEAFDLGMQAMEKAIAKLYEVTKSPKAKAMDDIVKKFNMAISLLEGALKDWANWMAANFDNRASFGTVSTP